MPPTLYVYDGSPEARAVMITARAIGLTLHVRRMDFSKSEHLNPEYVKMNPQRTVPTLDDNGKIIWDCRAIVGYLVGEYAKDDSLYPKDPYKRALVDQRLHFDSGVLFTCVRTVGLAYWRKEIKEIPPKISKEIEESYSLLETFLGDRQWVIGDTETVADFCLYTNVTSLDYHVKVDPKTYPNVTAWIKRLQDLPCCSSDEEELKAYADLFDRLKS